MRTLGVNDNSKWRTLWGSIQEINVSLMTSSFITLGSRDLFHCSPIGSRWPHITLAQALRDLLANMCYTSLPGNLVVTYLILWGLYFFKVTHPCSVYRNREAALKASAMSGGVIDPKKSFRDITNSSGWVRNCPPKVGLDNWLLRGNVTTPLKIEIKVVMHQQIRFAMSANATGKHRTCTAFLSVQTYYFRCISYNAFMCTATTQNLVYFSSNTKPENTDHCSLCPYKEWRELQPGTQCVRNVHIQ